VGFQTAIHKGGSMDYDKLQYGHRKSVREDQFIGFSRIVRGHIANYTVPQYGDFPNDEVEQWTAEQCILAIQKYTKRFASSQRGKLETLRDMVKIAHFACIAFHKIAESDEQVNKVMEGKV
jgi:hypothetical protein